MSKYKLNHIYPKDRIALKVLAKSGGISRESLNKLGISDTRIRNYEKSLVKSVSYPDKFGPGGCNSCYVLTTIGKSFCRKETNTYHFISNGNSSFHNTAVSDYLVNHLNKTELFSCLSERELGDFIQDRLEEYYNQGDLDRYNELLNKLESHELSMPDIVYTTTSGQVLAVEITTSCYSQKDIESKLVTSELLNIEIIFVPAN